MPAAEVVRRGEALLTGVTHDSREVRPGWLFASVPGRPGSDGDEQAVAQAAQAVRQGASALLVQRWFELPVPQLRVRRVRSVLGTVAAQVLGQPGRRLRLVAVTGTNGKTTTTLLLQAALTAGGVPAGVVGTLGARFGAETRPTGLTTPEAPHLQSLLARMADAETSVAIVEASSVGIDQGRVDALAFELAVHTGLEEEQLDHHGTIEHYYASKAALFEPDRTAAGIIRVDDPWGVRLAAQARVPVTTFGTGAGNGAGWQPDVRMADVRSGLDGTHVQLAGADGRVHLWAPLLGRVNAANLTAAYLAARHLGLSREEAAAGLGTLTPPPGRHTVLRVEDRPLVIVDYAHTPRALAALVRTARDLAGPGGRVHVVFGGRGERDRVKRPELGRAAGTADRVVLTSDSTQTEDMAAILAEYRLGLLTSTTPVEVVHDRRASIERAIATADPGDVVVVAGRGHETRLRHAGYDEHFDDRAVAAELLRATPPS